MEALPELLETERTFAAEQRDANWSTEAETRILAKFAEVPGLELASVDVECRQTLCRLRLVSSRTVPQRPPTAEELAKLRAGPQLPGIAELVRETGMHGVWVWGLNPVSMAYLERGESADTPAGTR
jgi:hypothetical protein